MTQKSFTSLFYQFSCFYGDTNLIPLHCHANSLYYVGLWSFQGHWNAVQLNWDLCANVIQIAWTPVTEHKCSWFSPLPQGASMQCVTVKLSKNMFRTQFRILNFKTIFSTGSFIKSLNVDANTVVHLHSQSLQNDEVGYQFYLL